MAKQLYFVAGTDTDVGKTVVACGLLSKAARDGLRTLALKPVAAGCEDSAEGPRNEDALALQAACNSDLDYQQVNPVALNAAIAPHIAASQEGKILTAERLAGYCRGVMYQPADMVLIEGAGGWRVPLNGRETLADVAKMLNCQVILVVGMRLGCISHALLSVEAIKNDGLQLAGWVANILDPDMPCLQENIQTLQQMVAAPCLGVVPRLEDGGNSEQVADHVSLPDSVGEQA